MKLEIKTNNKGYCDYFKINGVEYGKGIYAVDIHIETGKPVKCIIQAKSDEFILDSNDTKLYLEKYDKDKTQ